MFSDKVDRLTQKKEKECRSRDKKNKKKAKKMHEETERDGVV